MKKEYILPISLMVIWMLLIFAFSSQTSAESHSFSESIAGYLVEIVHPGLTAPQKQFTIKEYDFIMRKVAHFLMYMILSIISMFIFARLRKKPIFTIILTFAACAIYAATDEIHQVFVNGRSSQFVDFIVDISGALLGIAIFRIWKMINTRYRHTRS